MAEDKRAEHEVTGLNEEIEDLDLKEEQTDEVKGGTLYAPSGGTVQSTGTAGGYAATPGFEQKDYSFGNSNASNSNAIAP